MQLTHADVPSPVNPEHVTSSLDGRRDSLQSDFTSVTNTTSATIHIDKLDAINAERLRILEEMTQGDADQARGMLDDYLEEVLFVCFAITC